MMSPTLEQTAVPAGLTPDLKIIDNSRAPLLTQAAALTPIASLEQYHVIDGLIGRIQAARKEVSEYIDKVFAKHIATAYKAHKDLCTDRTKYLAEHDKPLAEAQAKAIALIRSFEEEERKRQEKLREEAETRRKADEKAAAEKAEAERKEQIKKDEAERLAKAEALENSGQAAEAEKLLSAPPPPPPPPVQPIPQHAYYAAPAPLKAASLGSRKNWIGRLKGGGPETLRASFLELVKAAAANPDAYLDFLSINERTIKDRAKSQEAQARVPGIEFLNQPTDIAKARA